MQNSKKYDKQYYENNKEKYYEWSKKYRKNNPEKVKEYKKRWEEKNPEYHKEYYLKNRKKRLDCCKEWVNNNPKKMKKINKRYYLKRRQFIQNYKLSKGCSICGYDKCAYALDFHHRDDDKEFNIGSMGWGINRIEKEMEKCIILCANCHRELHANPKGDLYE